MRIVLTAHMAKSAMGFTSTEQTRFYLGGFKLDTTKTRHGGVKLVATDGHTMGMFHDSAAIVHGSFGRDIIIKLPKAIILECGKASHLTKWVVIDQVVFPSARIRVVSANSAADVDDNSIEIISINEKEAFIDGTFPDYMRALPSEVAVSAPIGAFNAKYMAKFAAVAMNERKGFASCVDVVAGSSENFASAPMHVFVPDCPWFHGVIMPMRSCTPTTMPDWLVDATNDTAKAA